jgi:hypothetical protein
MGMETISGAERITEHCSMLLSEPQGAILYRKMFLAASLRNLEYVAI